jgi:hypothetical protein
MTRSIHFKNTFVNVRVIMVSANSVSSLPEKKLHFAVHPHKPQIHPGVDDALWTIPDS